jgi:hypothetical protein
MHLKSNLVPLLNPLIGLSGSLRSGWWWLAQQV